MSQDNTKGDIVEILLLVVNLACIVGMAVGGLIVLASLLLHLVGVC